VPSGISQLHCNVATWTGDRNDKTVVYKLCEFFNIEMSVVCILPVGPHR
jgi:hypothetical protein